MTNLLVLAAESSSDPKDGDYPVFLNDFFGMSLLEQWLLEARKLHGKLLLAVDEVDSKKWHLKEAIMQAQPNAELFNLTGKTSGATSTALLALADSGFDFESPLLVLNGNEKLDFDFSKVIQYFLESDSDAGLVYFDSIHPRYSYARIDEQGNVQETAEKVPISRNATAGFYWFRTIEIFRFAAESQLLKRNQSFGKFYICPLMNEIILTGGKVSSYKINSSQFVPMKSERQISKDKNGWA